MKRPRLLRISILLLVVTLMISLMNTTFSWFSRPRELTGKNLNLTDSYNTSVKVDDNTITFNTYESSDGKLYGDEPVNRFYESVGIASGGRKYYRTDIYNSGSEPQSVSLYAASLTKGLNCDGIALGVNGPTKTYKMLSNLDSTQTVSHIYKQNVYLGLHAKEVGEGKLTNNIDYIHAWNYNGVEYDAYWGSDIVSLPNKTANYVADDNRWNNVEQVFNIYSATIDSRATSMQLKTKNNGTIGEVKIYNNDDYKGNIVQNNTMIFYEYGNAYYVEPEVSDLHARLHTFYSDASVQVGSSIDLSADAYGKSVQYFSSNESVATVNKSTGVVTGVNEGIAKITVKVYGVHQDCLEATCILSVSSNPNQILDVPIATNMLISGATTGSDGESVPGMISVYWYIKNDSATAGMTYNIPEIYVSL